MTSLRLPPVSETASGIPCASVIRWCFEPGRARSTGLGPVLGRPSAPARESCQSPPATSPVHQRRAVQPAMTRAAAARLRPGASPAAAASRSSRTRSPAPAARTPTGCRCRGRTRSRTGPSGHRAAYGRDDQPGVAPPAATARSAPITRPGQSTVAAGPSSQACPTTTPSPVFPPVILLAVLSPRVIQLAPCRHEPPPVSPQAVGSPGDSLETEARCSSRGGRLRGRVLSYALTVPLTPSRMAYPELSARSQACGQGQVPGCGLFIARSVSLL